MLSCLIAVFADYFVSRTTKARDSEMRTALYALTQSCNNALSNAYATAMQSRMQELVRNKGSISDFTLELPTGTMQDCYAVVRGAFRDYVYYNSSNSEVEDPFNRSYTGAKPIDGLAPLLAIPEELYVNIQYIVQKPNESAVAPDFAATKSSHNPSYAWRFEYRGASTVSFTLYHTLVVTIFTDKDGLDFRAGIPALANYIKDGVINAANVVFTLHTQCEAEGFNMDGFEPMATSETISSPFSTNLLARFADNPLVDDEQPEVPDVPDLRFARAGFDDLTLSVSFNQGSTPDTTPSGNITLKDLDLRQNITLEEGESVEWSISGSSAVIRGNGTSADIVFSGIDYARLAAGNHDFVETVTAKIIKDGKVVRTITGKVRLGSKVGTVTVKQIDVINHGTTEYPMYAYYPMCMTIDTLPLPYDCQSVVVSPLLFYADVSLTANIAVGNNVKFSAWVNAGVPNGSVSVESYTVNYSLTEINTQTTGKVVKIIVHENYKTVLIDSPIFEKLIPSEATYKASRNTPSYFSLIARRGDKPQILCSNQYDMINVISGGGISTTGDILQMRDSAAFTAVCLCGFGGQLLWVEDSLNYRSIQELSDNGCLSNHMADISASYYLYVKNTSRLLPAQGGIAGSVTDTYSAITGGWGVFTQCKDLEIVK